MGALNSLASVGLNLALQQKAQAAEDKQLRQERDRQLEAIRLRDTEDQRQQQQALRRRLAEERARAGGAGVGSSGGAADAILSGLVAGEPAARRRPHTAISHCVPMTSAAALPTADAAACSTSPAVRSRSAAA